MAERLLETTNMVKELLQSNRQLREIIDKKSSDLDKANNENVALQLENQDLKDKVDVLTNLLRPPNADDILNLDARELFSDDPQMTLHIGGCSHTAYYQTHYKGGDGHWLKYCSAPPPPLAGAGSKRCHGAAM